jgi:hypothetical protein
VNDEDYDDYDDNLRAELASRPRMTSDILGRRVPAVENTEPSRCYSASFGMVHVRPGCRCKRRR